jgi:hypothetical protein
MAKAKSTKVENQEENLVNQIEVKEEVVVKEIESKDNTPEEINNIVEEEVKENNTQEVKQFTPIQNRNKVQSIIQKRPSHYSLLMEDGRQLVVHKSIFDKERMIVLQD